jgi:hypothetical protein
MHRSINIAGFISTVRGHTFTAMVALLFVSSQILCCFHTHDPFEDVGKSTKADVECEICLVSSMPVDVGDDTSTAGNFDNGETKSLAVATNFRPEAIASPDSARAPPTA